MYLYATLQMPNSYALLIMSIELKAKWYFHKTCKFLSSTKFTLTKSGIFNDLLSHIIPEPV